MNCKKINVPKKLCQVFCFSSHFHERKSFLLNFINHTKKTFHKTHFQTSNFISQHNFSQLLSVSICRKHPWIRIIRYFAERNMKNFLPFSVYRTFENEMIEVMAKLSSFEDLENLETAFDGEEPYTNLETLQEKTLFTRGPKVLT